MNFISLGIMSLYTSSGYNILTPPPKNENTSQIKTKVILITSAVCIELLLKTVIDSLGVLKNYLLDLINSILP